AQRARLRSGQRLRGRRDVALAIPDLTGATAGEGYNARKRSPTQSFGPHCHALPLKTANTRALEATPRASLHPKLPRPRRGVRTTPSGPTARRLFHGSGTFFPGRTLSFTTSHFRTPSVPCLVSPSMIIRGVPWPTTTWF